jgi:hypothetical protein
LGVCFYELLPHVAVLLLDPTLEVEGVQESPAFSTQESKDEWLSFLSRMLRPKLLELGLYINTMWSDKPYPLSRSTCGFFESSAFSSILQHHFDTLPDPNGPDFPRILIETTTMVASLIEYKRPESETAPVVISRYFRYLVCFLLRYAVPGLQNSAPSDHMRKACLLNIRDLVAGWFEKNPAQAIRTVGKLTEADLRLVRAGGRESVEYILMPITTRLLFSTLVSQRTRRTDIDREAIEFAFKAHSAFARVHDVWNAALFRGCLQFPDVDLPNGWEEFALQQAYCFPHSVLQMILEQASLTEPDFVSTSSRLSTVFEVAVQASVRLIPEVCSR